MLEIFTGDDRIRAGQAISKILGPDHETIDGETIEPSDMPSLFFGASLFTAKRRILVRDLSSNKPAFEKLPDYLDTPHDIILLELKLDKRSAAYKAIKDKIKITDFTLPANPNFRLVFDVYRTAKTNGPRAITTLAKIKADEDPIKFVGLLASQAIKDYTTHPAAREKRILRALAHLDIQMKTTGIEPWSLVEAFLLQLSTI